jgi:hypothetical protein
VLTQKLQKEIGKMANILCKLSQNVKHCTKASSRLKPDFPSSQNSASRSGGNKIIFKERVLTNKSQVPSANPLSTERVRSD